MEDTKPKRGRPRKYPDLPTTTDEPRRPRGRPRKYQPGEPITTERTTRDQAAYEWKVAHREKWLEYQRNYQREYRLRNAERWKEIADDHRQRKKECTDEHND